MKYNSQTVNGHDYSRPLADMLPEIIGPRRHAKSVAQIAAAAGRQRQTVERVLNRMHAKSEVHVARWTRGTSGPFIEMWKLGPGADADKPTPMTNAEKVKRYQMSEKGKAATRRARKKWRKTGAAKEYLRKYRQNRSAKQKFSTGGVAAIDPLLAAIMGSSAQTTKEL